MQINSTGILTGILKCRGKIKFEIAAYPPISAAAIALVSALPTTSNAQSLPPQAHYFADEGSVDLKRGTFLYERTDFMAGSPDSRHTIPFTRLYNVSGSGDGPFGPATNHNLTIAIHVERFREEPNGPGRPSFRWHVVKGASVETFYRGYGDNQIYYVGGSGGFHTLTMATENGPFTYKGPDGLLIDFKLAEYLNVGCRSVGFGGAAWCGQANHVEFGDGYRWDFRYNSRQMLSSINGNNGFSIGIDYDANDKISKSCIINATINALQATPCSGSLSSTLYQYSCFSASCFLQNVTTDSLIQVSYGHGPISSSPFSGTVLKTISTPGQTSPTVSIDYFANSGKIKSQTYADGHVRSYSYLYNDEPWEVTPFNDHTTITTSAGIRTFEFLGASPTKPSKFTDELGRTSQFVYTWAAGRSVLQRQTDPTGRVVEYSYGISPPNAYSLIPHPTQTRRMGRPGSGSVDIISAASYALSCVNPKTCEKPLTRTDERGHVTEYTYAPEHGGVLTEMGPADASGVRPVKRSAYAQHYAWLRNIGSGYSPAASPIWLLSEERACRTTATIGNACAGGAADEVVTTYQYQQGNASTPSNLLLKGVAVTADGQTLRTCYGYDAMGRRISETKPNAGLATCA